MSQAENPIVHYAVLLYPGFQALDVFGAIDILNILSQTTMVKMSVIAPTLEPVSTHVPAMSHSIGQAIVPTHSVHHPPEDIDVLLVPGGKGCRDIESTEPLVEFLRVTYPKLKYLLTVCTGSSLAARAHLLDGKRATSNKFALKWVR
jgi:putative intracellular protease/amidase